MNKVLDQETISQIQTAAFCAYVMMVEKCSKEQALKRMGNLCSATQIALGLGNSDLRKSA